MFHWQSSVVERKKAQTWCRYLMSQVLCSVEPRGKVAMARSLKSVKGWL